MLQQQAQSVPRSRKAGTSVQQCEPIGQQQFILSRDDVQQLIDIRKTFAYLVNETSDGRHFRDTLHSFDAILNELVGFEVYDVPEERDKSEASAGQG